MDVWKEIAVTSDENDRFCACRIWDFRTGNEINTIPHGATKSQCLSFIDDNHLICGSKDPKVLNVWTLSKQIKDSVPIKCIAPINALAVSSNGTYCIGGITSKLYIWQISTGELIGLITEHYNTVNCIKFDETESYFVTAGEDGLMMAWSISNLIGSAFSKNAETSLSKPLHVWKDHTLGIKDACVTSRGVFPRAISVSRDKSCRIYNLLNGTCVFSIYTDEELHSLALDPLGCFIYLGTSSGAIFKAPTNFVTVETSLNIKQNYEDVFHEHENIVNCLSVSADGQYLLSGSTDCKAMVWNLKFRILLQVLKHEGPVLNAFFRPYPHLLDSAENKKSMLLIKPFQFVVSNHDSELVEVVLSAHKPPKNGYSDSMLDSFFGEEEILPQEKERMALQYSKFNDQNLTLYRQAQILNLLK